MLTPVFPEVAPGPLLVAEVYVPITEPIIQEPEPVPEPIAEEAQVPLYFRQQRNTLWYLYQPLPPPSSRPCNHLHSFRPTVGEFADDSEMGDVNNPVKRPPALGTFFLLT